MAYILAIDQSTSATKAVLYDAAAAEPLDHAAAEHRQIYPQPGWVEHDAEEIWRNVQTVVAALVGRNEHRMRELLCLSITNQRETVVVFDRTTGRPLHNAIVWQCRRGEPVCDELRRRGEEDAVTAKTGLRIDTYFSGSKLAWLVRNDESLAAKFRRGEALIGTIDAYLVHRLTNGQVFATDQTNASRTLLFDIHRLGWDDELCRLFGASRAALPEVRDSSARFGETDLGGVLPRRVPICGVMGDSQAALLAHGCVQRGTAKVTVGTGSSVLLNTGNTPRAATNGAVTSLAWVLNGKPSYCLEGIINFSAATLAWLRDRLGLIQSFDEAEPLAVAAGDNGGVYLVPAFAGLGAPYWRPNARAAIVGLTAHSGREHLVRAALESIAYQVCDVLEMMSKQAKGAVKLSVIRADGGATGNRFLMQFTADLLGLDVEVADNAECSPRGAAMAGALGMGVHRTVDDLARMPRPSTRYRRTMPPARAAEHHAGWQRAVASVLAQHPS